jgi:shikimate kinase
MKLITFSLLLQFTLYASSYGFYFTQRILKNALHSSTEPITTTSLTPFEELRIKLKGTPIYFVGMMASGKSLIGSKFAEMLDYRYFDADELAEFMIEMPIPQFFAESGEDSFRNVENQILMEICQYKNLVVSTGGGSVMRNDNWGHLRHGVVVFLNVPIPVIYERLKNNPEEVKKRPLLAKESPLQALEEIFQKREENYKQADLHFNHPAELNLDDTLTLLARELIKFIDNNPPQWLKWKEERFGKTDKQANVSDNDNGFSETEPVMQ